MEVVALTHQHTSAFLIRGDGWLMVDAGYPESYSAFKSCMRQHGITWADVRALVVTHFHPDHAGLVQVVREHGVRLLLHQCQEGYVGWINRFFERHLHKQYVPIELEGLGYLDSAESRSLLGRWGIAGEIIPTPGHSDDSVSVVVDGEGAFVGDLTHWDVVREADMPVAAESWRRILSFDVHAIYPAHGAPYTVEKPGG